MNIEIGTKKFKDLTAENIMSIVLILEICPALIFWNKPVLLDFNNTKFDDTVVIEYESYRISDNKKSCKYTLFFDFKNFRYQYINDAGSKLSSKLGISELKYLIQEGFDIPLY